MAEGDTILRAAGRIDEVNIFKSEACFAARHARAVYRRSGQPCPNCGSTILSRGQGDANRTTYWCPRCQPASAGD